MTDDGDDDLEGLDLAALIIVISILSFYALVIVCSGGCFCCFGIFYEWRYSRKNSRRRSVPSIPIVPIVPNVPDDPPETETDWLEGVPRVCDVRIIPWHSLCSQPDPRPGRLGLGRCGKHNTDHTVNDQKRARWGGFLVSHNQSINPFILGWCRVLTFGSWISSHCLQIRCPTRMRLFPHPEGGAAVPPNAHHRPKSVLAPSSSCPPFH